MKVLIIEDEPVLQEAYGYVLARHGFRIHLASAGIEGLAMVFCHEPDIVLLDIDLPDVDGLAVLERIGLHPSLPTRVIIYSNFDEYREQALRLGAADYMAKASFTPKEMVARIQEILAYQ